MTKIIYISYLPATTHFIKNHYIDDMLNNGANVEYWDISKLFFSDIPLPDKVDSNFIVKVCDERDLKNRLLSEEGSNTIFVIGFHCRWETLWLYKILFKGNFHTVFFDVGSLPTPQRDGGVSVRFIELILRAQIRTIVKAFLYRIMSYLYGMRNISYETVFAAGMEAVRRYEGRSHVVKINHYDYDAYLKLNESSVHQTKKDYVVFIDQYQGYHPEPVLMGRRSLNPVNYQCGINKFLELVEDRYNVDVVIAAHPKSDYQDGVFDGRRILKYKTNELIRDCAFVLSHGSTSLSFAILYQKPIILLYNNELKDLGESSNYPLVETFSSILGAPAYNVDEVNCVEQITVPSVDLDKYAQYKYEYLTSPQTERKRSKDIFLDFIRE